MNTKTIKNKYIVTFVLDLQCDCNPSVTYSLEKILTDKDINKIQEAYVTESTDKEFEEVIEEIFDKLNIKYTYEANPHYVDKCVYV